MMDRHFAWFRMQDGQWIGEWTGHVPSPTVPASLIGDARLMLLNEWTQQTQRGITPFASAYETTAQAWDLDAWDDCPPGGAVCLDVTMYNWPVGDFVWAVFDGVDRLGDFREMRTYLQLTPATAMIDAVAKSPRPIRDKPTKLIADITGTSLEPFAERLMGRLVRRDGRIVFEPNQAELPEAVVLSITDRNPDLSIFMRPSVIKELVSR